MIAKLAACSLSSTKNLSAKLKTLFAIGDSMTLDNAADLLKTFQSELKCLVTSTTGLYGGYFEAISVTIEGAVSSGSSLSY
jgi:hypothetical protein